MALTEQHVEIARGLVQGSQRQSDQLRLDSGFEPADGSVLAKELADVEPTLLGDGARTRARYVRRSSRRSRASAQSTTTSPPRIRDSGLNALNNVEAFFEIFENVANTGLESLKLTSTVCVSGQAAALEPIDCPTSGS